ncbi:intercellular adhesion molecule 1 [Otolemur garnettii]|uniref:Intercellular adhesion molecule 1 n=1 Tax=Otolemur garnettii TaxID=30611 RepID=H0X402_OTOGA|nr:intercellular adhesion molecule 1 [Otolemur garnettii]
MALGGVLRTLPVLLALLGALLPGPGEAQTFVSPSKAMLPRGGSLQINCSSSCDQKATVGLETPLTKRLVTRGDNWIVYELSNVGRDSKPICFSNCNNNQSSVGASLTVYWYPDKVELAPLPSWQPVGEKLTLSCQVFGGAPRNHLSAVLLRGDEVLSSQQMDGEPTKVTATLLVGRSDHRVNFSCRSELDLRTQGLGLFKNTSAPYQLQTFVLPSTLPKLVTPGLLETGTEGTVECSLDGLFPVLEAQIHLALGDQRLNPKITYKNESLLAKAFVKANAEEKGSQQLTCAVILGNQSRQISQRVTIYSFPEPNLTLSKAEVSEGTEVLVHCKAHPGAVVMLSGAPAGPLGWWAQFLLNASAEDNRRIFSCHATMKVDGQMLNKTQTQELHVLYGPRLDKTDCPGNWTWEEGSQQTLRCQAQGNPSPQLNCSRKGDGILLPIGNLSYITRNLMGTYICRAVSTRGEITREVFIKVLYSDHQTSVVIILVTAIIVLGTVGITAYLYNRQRKIKKYKLQEAQKVASMKLNTQATPP